MSFGNLQLTVWKPLDLLFIQEYKRHMDILTQFEEKVEHLLGRLRVLETENLRLQQELDSERTQKQEVLGRIDNLLKKIQEMNM